MAEIDEQPQCKKSKVDPEFPVSVWESGSIEMSPGGDLVEPEADSVENHDHDPPDPYMDENNGETLEESDSPPGSQSTDNMTDEIESNTALPIPADEPESTAKMSSEPEEAGETPQVVTNPLKTESPDSSSSDDIEVLQADVHQKRKRRSTQHRRNIKEILGQDKLDERTLAAQREEWARRQRMAAKLQNLGKNPSLPLSLEQIMERFSTKSLVSMTPVSDAPAETAPRVEHEVLTLSSDDEDCVPAPKAYPYEYESYKSESGYSGGTMIVPSPNGDIDHSSIGLGMEVDSKAEGYDSSDDCVVLSPSGQEEAEEKDEDELNVPDGLGRILINVGHPPEEPDIFLAPTIAKTIKPHQIGGIRFLYDNVIETLETYNTSSGLGCILAHSMGLGKTIQAAAFCDIFLNHTSANTVLVIVPINTIQNWLNEFNHWLPSAKCPEPSANGPATPKRRGRKKQPAAGPDPEGAGLKKSENNTPSSSGSPEGSEPDESLDGDKSSSRTYNVFLLNETVKNLAGRARIISEWTTKRGVLLIGYEMYRMLALKKLKKPGRKKPQAYPTINDGQLRKDVEDELLLDRIYSSLVKPGPDLVICDEGHRIKNSGASISQALKAIKTRRRIVLTGYPLQNNLMEYWCMVDFIRPNYLGTKNEFSNMFERPITNGQCSDSTPSDKRLMQFRSHVLHSVLEGFVQRRSHLVLQRALPPKEEWVFLVKMTPVQTNLYKEFISYIKLMAEMGHASPNPIKAFAICCKIWNHPDVLYNVAVAKKEQSNVLDDLEDLADEVEGFKKRPTRRKPQDSPANKLECGVSAGNEDSDGLPIFCNWGASSSYSSNGLNKDRESMRDSLLSLEWALPALKDYTPNVLENGTKFELLFIIIEETAAVGDKLLVFSQSLLTLDLMEMFLGMKFGWFKNRDYFRLDGSTGGLERERLIKEFNSEGRPELRLFLVSTRAGSLGINLIGANRVVVFDASWNPCHDCQAVCRIYRYGQKKPCQIYRFVTDCTLEKKIYDRQITKRGMANRVVDEMNPDSHFNSKDMSGSLLLDLDNLIELQGTTFQHSPEKFHDPIMQQLLIKGGDKITKDPFEHESLLIDRKDKKLSASERRLALRNYEMEKKAVMNQGMSGPAPGRQAYTSPAGYPPPTSTKYPYSGYPSGGSFNLGPDYTSGGYSSSSNMMFPSYGTDYNYGSDNSRDPYFPPEFGESGPGPNSRFEHQSLPLPLPVDELRKKGISVQGIVLKKDSFLADPDGGPDMYLMAGQKVYLFRSNKGTYLRMSNGRFIAIRKRGKGAAQSILDHIPPTQDLSKEQVYVVITSILRPKISSTLAQLQEYTEGTGYRAGSSIRSRYSCNNRLGYNYGPPVAVPLPASYPPYGNQNQQNLQITNHNSSSGGDVTIWKKSGGDPVQSSATNPSEIVPEIEVIKINPKLRGQRQSHAHNSSYSSRPFLPPPPAPSFTPMDMELLESRTPVGQTAKSDFSTSAVPSRRRSPPSFSPQSTSINSMFPNLNFKDIEISRPGPPPPSAYQNFSDLISLPNNSNMYSSSSKYSNSTSSVVDLDKFTSSGTSFRRGDVVFETGPKVPSRNGNGNKDSESNIFYNESNTASSNNSQIGQYYSDGGLFTPIEQEILQQHGN